MVKVFVLIETSIGATPKIKEALSAIIEVEFVHSVTGPFDIILMLEAENTEKISEIVLKQIRIIEGISRTLTCVVMG